MWMVGQWNTKMTVSFVPSDGSHRTIVAPFSRWIRGEWARVGVEIVPTTQFLFYFDDAQLTSLENCTQLFSDFSSILSLSLSLSLSFFLSVSHFYFSSSSFMVRLWAWPKPITALSFYTFSSRMAEREREREKERSSSFTFCNAGWFLSPLPLCVCVSPVAQRLPPATPSSTRASIVVFTSFFIRVLPLFLSIALRLLTAGDLSIRNKALVKIEIIDRFIHWRIGKETNMKKKKIRTASPSDRLYA